MRPSLPIFAAAIGLAAASPAQSADLREPLVFLVADGARADALDGILTAAGMRRRRIPSADCRPAALRLADVVVVDWPDGSDLGDALPLGGPDRWDRPTVFVGGTGERFARRWGLPGPGEMARLGADERGPEMERLAPPPGTTAEAWRQGHLLHFTCTTEPADFTAAEREWLLRLLRYAARFTTDRPILRHATADGAPLPDAERQRRERIAAATAALGIDVRDAAAVLGLPDRLEDSKPTAFATTLLVDLVADGPGAGTTRNNWKHWLRSRGSELAWDGLSHAWRLDEVAYWRDVPSHTLRGAQRADGGDRDADALALCTKVVQRYGGRGFDDLETFTCWHGQVHLTWDRRNGWFRAENHAEPRAGMRATRWQVAVLDTAADRELIWGGGPPPQPRVSARGDYRDLVVRVFLPSMLLDPGVHVARRPAADDGRLRALVVRLGQRGLDLRTDYVVLADGDSGEIARVEEHTGGRRARTWVLAATAACGPMLLPTSWLEEGGRREFAIEDPAWNPELPAGIESSTERLAKPRGG